MRRAVMVVGLLSACSFQVAGSGAGPSPPGDASDEAGADADGPVDAVLDAAIDASSSPTLDASAGCSALGLVCPGGTTPRAITCGNGCWYGCTDGPGVTEPIAAQLCRDWGGVLAHLDSAADETCMRSALDGAIWIGLEQAANQSSPSAGWSWNGDGVAPQFLNWAGGQPNDSNGNENNAEQCAYDSTSASWQDTSCMSTNSRFSCRK